MSSSSSICSEGASKATEYTAKNITQENLYSQKKNTEQYYSKLRLQSDECSCVFFFLSRSHNIAIEQSSSVR